MKAYRIALDAIIITTDDDDLSPDCWALDALLRHLKYHPEAVEVTHQQLHAKPLRRAPRGRPGPEPRVRTVVDVGGVALTLPQLCKALEALSLRGETDLYVFDTEHGTNASIEAVTMNGLAIQITISPQI